MKGSRRVRVMVVAGGSAGHILPAVGFCEEVFDAQRDFIDLHFIVCGRKKTEAWISGDVQAVFLEANKTPWGLFKLFCETFFLIFKVRPHVVVGFGGYMSVPFVLLAAGLRKRTIIHEQNVIPGAANRFLSFFADKTAISFASSRQYFWPKRQKKVFLTRYPLRKSLERAPRQEALNFFCLNERLFTVLVVGGSQGSRRLNEVFLEALRQNKNLEQLQIIHLAGSKDYLTVEEAYRSVLVKSKIFAFLPEMHYAYSAADLVVSRAGAGSVVEIMRFAVPSVLIPYPYAGAHQVANARFLAEKGAALLLEEARMTPSLLAGLIDIFSTDNIRRKTMSVQLVSLYEASQNLRLSDLLFL